MARGAIQLNPFLSFAFCKLEDVQINKIPSEMEASLPQRHKRVRWDRSCPFYRASKKMSFWNFSGTNPYSRTALEQYSAVHFGSVSFFLAAFELIFSMLVLRHRPTHSGQDGKKFLSSSSQSDFFLSFDNIDNKVKNLVKIDLSDKIR